MRAIRGLLSFLLVLVAVYCVVAWAFYFNPAFEQMAGTKLPLEAWDFPGGPDIGPLAIAMLTFVIAYLVWPPPQRAEVVEH